MYQFITGTTIAETDPAAPSSPCTNLSFPSPLFCLCSFNYLRRTLKRRQKLTKTSTILHSCALVGIKTQSAFVIKCDSFKLSKKLLIQPNVAYHDIMNIRTCLSFVKLYKIVNYIKSYNRMCKVIQIPSEKYLKKVTFVTAICMLKRQSTVTETTC